MAVILFFLLVITINLSSQCFISDNIECSCLIDMVTCSGIQKETSELQLLLSNISLAYSGHLETLILSLENLTESELIFINISVTNLTLGYGLRYLSNDLFHGLEYSLISLNLEHNNIKNISNKPFFFLNNLTKLILDFNELSEIEVDAFGNLNNLAYLSISGNQLSGLHENVLQNLSSLETLILNDNNISSFNNMSIESPFLKTLFMRNSSICGALDTYSLFGVPKLENLDLSFNRIKFVDSFALSALDSLKVLNLSYNVIERLEENAFRNLSNLINLDLKYNKLKVIKPGAFLNLKKLQILDLSGNLIAAMVCEYTIHMVSVRIVNLENNLMKTIIPGTFAYSPDLEQLHLQGNVLECSCDVHIFALFIQKNSSVSDKDVSSITCTSSHNETVLAVEYDAMGPCEHPELCEDQIWDEQDDQDEDDDDSRLLNDTESPSDASRTLLGTELPEKNESVSDFNSSHPLSVTYHVENVSTSTESNTTISSLNTDETEGNISVSKINNFTQYSSNVSDDNSEGTEPYNAERSSPNVIESSGPSNDSFEQLNCTTVSVNTEPIMMKTTELNVFSTTNAADSSLSSNDSSDKFNSTTSSTYTKPIVMKTIFSSTNATNTPVLSYNSFDELNMTTTSESNILSSTNATDLSVPSGNSLDQLNSTFSSAHTEPIVTEREELNVSSSLNITDLPVSSNNSFDQVNNTAISIYTKSIVMENSESMTESFVSPNGSISPTTVSSIATENSTDHSEVVLRKITESYDSSSISTVASISSPKSSEATSTTDNSKVTIKLINSTYENHLFCFSWNVEGTLHDGITCSIRYTNAVKAKTKRISCYDAKKELQKCLKADELYEICLIIRGGDSKMVGKHCENMSGALSLGSTGITDGTPSLSSRKTSTSRTYITEKSIHTTLKISHTTLKSAHTTLKNVSTALKSKHTLAPKMSGKNFSLPFSITAFDVYFDHSDIAVVVWEVNKYIPKALCNLTLRVESQYFNHTKIDLPCANNSYKVKDVKDHGLYQICLASSHKTEENMTVCKQPLTHSDEFEASENKASGFQNSSLIALLCLLALVLLIIMLIIFKNFYKGFESEKYDVSAEEEKVQKRLSTSTSQEASTRYSYIAKEQII